MLFCNEQVAYCEQLLYEHSCGSTLRLSKSIIIAYQKNVFMLLWCLEKVHL